MTCSASIPPTAAIVNFVVPNNGTWRDAIQFTDPSEVDAIAGVTVAPGRATMLYDGDVPVTASAVAHSSFGPRYRVVSAVQVGDVLELELLTVEDADAG